MGNTLMFPERTGIVDPMGSQWESRAADGGEVHLQPIEVCHIFEPLGYLPPAEYEVQFAQLATAPATPGALN